MYPNARVDGNPGGADWKSKLPEALKSKVPEGADNFYKDGDVYIFTKGGAAISGGKYKADGSVFTASSSSSSNMPALDNNQITQGIVQQGGSIFNFGAGTGVDLNSSFMGGNYNINTNKLMGSAGLLGAASMLASEAPLGLGGLLGSLAMPGIMAGFMKSLSFNFDFSNMFTSSQAGSGTGTLPEGFEQTALAGVYKKDGKFYKKDDNGNWLQCDDTGKIKDEAKLPDGYQKTATEGIYKKGEEYIKYDAETRTYVACDANGNKKADAPAAEKPAAETPAAEKPAADKPAAEKPAADKPATEKPAAEKPAANRRARTGRSVPQGWYAASADRSDAVKGITIDKMKAAQTGANGRSAARYVLDQVLGTKASTLTEQEKAHLQTEIIRRNPSVFEQNGSIAGMLKSNADITKLDIPTLDWIESKIRTTESERKNVTTQHQATARGGNGYTMAIVAGQHKYYNAKGEEISPEEFKSRCPNMYAQSRNNLIKGNNGYYAVKVANNKYEYYDPSHNKISDEKFKEKCPTIYAQTHRTQQMKSTEAQIAEQRAGAQAAAERYGQMNSGISL